MADYELAAQGLDEVAKCIKEFHDKMQFKTYSLYDEEVNPEVESAVNHDLHKAAVATSHWANKLQSLVKFSVRATRGHLIEEEAAETLRGLLTRDRKRTLDGLMDLLYVTVGACVALDLPVGAAFMEVHMSNMMKEKQTSDPYAERVRDKGPNFVPPDLEKVLEQWDSRTTSSEVSPSAGDAGE